MIGRPAPTSSPRQPLDIHVHLVGNGRSGSGCWLRMRGFHRLFAGVILKGIRLPISLDHPEFDQLYAARLVEYVNGSSLHAVVLAHDHAYDAQGNRLEAAGGFYVPNDCVLQLARAHPRVLPGVSIHPGRPDALEELERCLAGGAALMKCLPNCHNIDCSEPRYTKFWERMAEARLPLLAHTGGEHTVPEINPALANPRNLHRPLECGVNVIAAHCGTKSGFFDPDYFGWFRALTEQFPNFFGDTSALNLPLRSRALKACLGPALSPCLVHGSDYPVPIQGLWAFLRGHLPWRAYRGFQKNPNPIERDYRLKLAMGFRPDHFTRAWDILRVPAKTAAKE